MKTLNIDHELKIEAIKKTGCHYEGIIDYNNQTYFLFYDLYTNKLLNIDIELTIDHVIKLIALSRQGRD